MKKCLLCCLIVCCLNSYGVNAIILQMLHVSFGDVEPYKHILLDCFKYV